MLEIKATYWVNKVVWENPKVNANVEKNEPYYGSDDCCTNLKILFSFVFIAYQEHKQVPRNVPHS